MIDHGMNSRAPEKSPRSTPAEVYRRFTRVLEKFSDFDNFRTALSAAVESDPHLSNSLLLDVEVQGGDEFELFEMRRVVLPLRRDGQSGFLRVDGRRDERPFGAEDLQLMGAMAGFVSALVRQAECFGKKDQAEKILQYLINQLPLGVLCFATDGRLIVENNMAQRLLGGQGTDIIEKELSDKGRFQQGRVQMHFEVEGRLLYSEGRILEVEPGVEVVAYVLYDLSSSREKLMVNLELEAYRGELHGIPVTVALLESRSRPGAIYGLMKEAAPDLQVDAAKIQPLDAYSCVAIFEGKHVRSVRYLLKQSLLAGGATDVAAAVLACRGGGDSEASALIEDARCRLMAAGESLLPELIVMDAYPAVMEALEMMLSEVCRLRAEISVDAVEQLIRSGKIDGLFFDLDSFGADVLARLRLAAEAVGAGFRFYFCTYKKPSMIDASFEIARDDVVLQKPFDADAVIEVVTLHFDLA